MSGSLGYASRLSRRDDYGGTLGSAELLDDAPACSCPKLAQLCELAQQAQRIVVHTGAGISTAAGIPDFRGPQGVWTAEKRGEPLPRASCPFDRARPTLTHQALLALQRAGKLAYLVSCNVDGLHLRSGFPRHRLAELHGNCFAERCERCGTEYVRDFEQASVGFQRTGRACVACGGATRDQVLDWDDALPVAELAEAERQSSAACLSLTLGTSLQIQPAAGLPLRTLRAGGKLVVVNLQATPVDKRASLVLRRPADDVMRAVMASLRLPIPDYERRDSLLLRHETGNGGGAAGQLFTLHLQSCHGARCPLPWLASAQLRFPDGDGEVVARKRARSGEAAAAAAGSDWQPLGGGAPPWRLRLRALPASDGELRESVRVEVRLALAEGCSEQPEALCYRAGFTGVGGEQKFTILTDRCAYGGGGSGGGDGAAA